MILEVGVPVAVQDLASAVRGDSGTFIVQNGGQTYILEAKPGHSITFGPYPFGRKIQEIPSAANLTPEPWTITKLTNQFVSNEFVGATGNRDTDKGYRREMAAA